MVHTYPIANDYVIFERRISKAERLACSVGIKAGGLIILLSFVSDSVQWLVICTDCTCADRGFWSASVLLPVFHMLTARSNSAKFVPPNFR